jgi:hypothetical protein
VRGTRQLDHGFEQLAPNQLDRADKPDEPDRPDLPQTCGTSKFSRANIVFHRLLKGPDFIQFWRTTSNDPFCESTQNSLDCMNGLWRG